jgi:chemotaxis protein methyltransferase CheR
LDPPAHERPAAAAQMLLTPEISDQEFMLFQSLIRREAGIHLAPSKKPMLVSRLMRRVGALRLASFGDYYRYIVCSDGRELVHLLDAICTNETWFFRNPRHFTFIKDELAPRWVAEAESGKRPKRVTVWSAACASGEEPFSLAMVLLDALPGFEVEIQATDLSSRVLERAQAATWPLEKSSDIPPSYLKRYMLRGMGAQHGKMRATDELRRVVSFARVNLNEAFWAAEPARLDMIFCRNVLMYFEPGCRERAVRRLLARLSPRGYLFLGDAEGLNGVEGLRLVIPAAYTPKDNAIEIGDVDRSRPADRQAAR